MKCKVKANYLEVNGQLGKSLLVLLFLLFKLVAVPRKKLKSPWRHDDKQICTHRKNQFKLDIACETVSPRFLPLRTFRDSLRRHPGYFREE